mmetsp:Transcript_9972/g.21295  ORF Transcript_9972/g.21295 Transcript_9972/m.21295 type:complete len:224 (-) Transcript_9972:401-1072(-)
MWSPAVSIIWPNSCLSRCSFTPSLMGWLRSRTDTTKATRELYVHTAADRTLQPLFLSRDTTSASRPTRSVPASSNTVLSCRASSAWSVAPSSLLARSSVELATRGCCSVGCCWPWGGWSTLSTWRITCSLRSFVTFRLLSVTSNWSMNQPPSEDMRAFLTFRPSSVKHCTSSTSVPGRFAESSVSKVLSSNVSLSISTLGGCTRSSRVSYSSSTPVSVTELCW